MGDVLDAITCMLPLGALRSDDTAAALLPLACVQGFAVLVPPGSPASS
jgi:hypothetical protein